MRAHRNVERRLNRERLVPVLSASTLSSDFIPYPLVSSPFLANNCPFLLEPSVAGSWARLPSWNATKSFLSLFFLSFFSGFSIWLWAIEGRYWGIGRPISLIFYTNSNSFPISLRKIRNVDTFARFIHQRISRPANSLSVDLPPPSPCKNTWQGDEFHRRWRKGKEKKRRKRKRRNLFSSWKEKESAAGNSLIRLTGCLLVNHSSNT